MTLNELKIKWRNRSATAQAQADQSQIVSRATKLDGYVEALRECLSELDSLASGNPYVKVWELVEALDLPDGYGGCPDDRIVNYVRDLREQIETKAKAESEAGTDK